ncbi:MAG TPA: hypothetical protein VG222_16710 [Vicinamibacterales bacterium]|nr:hypothetical protein [Vicinamibacterales bacterium]
MSTTTSSPYAQPAIIGGLVMGVLSALPIVYAGNACCCLWVVCGGITAAYVFQQNQTMPIATGDGALVGLLAGFVGAGVHLVLSVPIDIVMAPIERAMAMRLGDMAGNMPSGMRDMIDQFSQRSAEAGIGLILIRRVFLFMLMLVVGSIFSTIGGLIGAVIFRKSLPPGTIDVTPHA